MGKDVSVNVQLVLSEAICYLIVNLRHLRCERLILCGLRRRGAGGAESTSHLISLVNPEFLTYVKLGSCDALSFSVALLHSLAEEVDGQLDAFGDHHPYCTCVRRSFLCLFASGLFLLVPHRRRRLLHHRRRRRRSHSCRGAASAASVLARASVRPLFRSLPRFSVMSSVDLGKVVQE